MVVFVGRQVFQEMSSINLVIRATPRNKTDINDNTSATATNKLANHSVLDQNTQYYTNIFSG